MTPASTAPQDTRLKWSVCTSSSEVIGGYRAIARLRLIRLRRHLHSPGRGHLANPAGERSSCEDINSLSRAFFESVISKTRNWGPIMDPVSAGVRSSGTSAMRRCCELRDLLSTLEKQLPRSALTRYLRPQLENLRVCIAAAAIALAGSAVIVHYRARAAERAHPPRGAFVTTDGVRLHYIERGSGRPVVFLHGNGRDF